MAELIDKSLYYPLLSPEKRIIGKEFSDRVGGFSGGMGSFSDSIEGFSDSVSSIDRDNI